MPATKTDLVGPNAIEQGADWAHGWAVTYNGTPIDATWTARSQVRERVSAVGILHTFSASVDAGGNVVIGAAAAVSSAWAWRDGVYDVEVVNADASVTLRVAEGRVQVDPEVTR